VGGGAGTAPAAADKQLPLVLTAETFGEAGLSPLDALRDLVCEDVRCDPVVRLCVLDARVGRYVCARTERLLLNVLRWALALELLPPVGVAPKDRSAFKHPDPDPAELMALRMRWLAHAAKAILGFALAMPSAEPFAWPDAVKERSFGGRYGYLGGWSPPWFEGWPYKGVFPGSWTGKEGERRWRHWPIEL
jgi:hypothetical protein